MPEPLSVTQRVRQWKTFRDIGRRCVSLVAVRGSGVSVVFGEEATASLRP